MHSFLPLTALYNETVSMAFGRLFIVSAIDIITGYLGIFLSSLERYILIFSKCIYLQCLIKQPPFQKVLVDLVLVLKLCIQCLYCEVGELN